MHNIPSISDPTDRDHFLNEGDFHKRAKKSTIALSLENAKTAPHSGAVSRADKLCRQKFILRFDQPVISSSHRHELVMRSLFFNQAVVEDDDMVGMADRR